MLKSGGLAYIFYVDFALLSPMSSFVVACTGCSTPRCDSCDAPLPCLLQRCRTCPWDICTRILCQECHANHRHAVLVAQPHFNRWVNELMGSFVVLRGLRFTGEVKGDIAYCCLDVTSCVIENAGTILHFLKAHISIAKIVLRGRPGHKDLSSQSDATNFFWLTVSNKHESLPPDGLRGRLGHHQSRPWRGPPWRVPRRVCCLDLCNDHLGCYCETLARAFEVLQPERPRTVMWLRGRELHFSIYGSASLVQIQNVCCAD